jgi:hypothetical protein
MSMLRRGWNAVIADSMPGSLKVSVFGTGVEVGSGKQRPWDTGEILRLADQAARDAGKRIWLLFDNLDELLAAHRRKRIEALNALFTVCNQLRASYPSIQPRIFLRTDIWTDLEFNNKSHWVGKELRLSWSDEQLLRLMLKRVVNSDPVRAHLARALPALTGPQAVDEMSVADLQSAFFVLFEPHIDANGTGDSWRWMLDRQCRRAPSSPSARADHIRQSRQGEAAGGPLFGRRAGHEPGGDQKSLPRRLEIAL